MGPENVKLFLREPLVFDLSRLAKFWPFLKQFRRIQAQFPALALAGVIRLFLHSQTACLFLVKFP